MTGWTSALSSQRVSARKAPSAPSTNSDRKLKVKSKRKKVESTLRREREKKKAPGTLGGRLEARSSWRPSPAIRNGRNRHLTTYNERNPGSSAFPVRRGALTQGSLVVLQAGKNATSHFRKKGKRKKKKRGGIKREIRKRMKLAGVHEQARDGSAPRNPGERKKGKKTSSAV